MARAPIRESRPGDLAGIRTLYRSAFPEEDLLPLVRDLLRERRDVLSFVTTDRGAVTGHVALSRCEIARRRGAVALLGPLAVAPERQGRCAWQSIALGPASVPGGRPAVPPPWRRPALWAP